MSNSSLVDYVKISPHKTSPRQDKIRKITIHHMAGELTVEQCGEIFQTREASTNYGIGKDGRIGMYVEEKDRAWATGSGANDHQSINIELANDEIGGSWHISDKVVARCIELCVDICKRNGINKLNYTGDDSGNLTMHCWFMATACPGAYLKTKFQYIADEVNKRLVNPTPSEKWTGKYPTLPSRGYYLKGDGYNTYPTLKNQIKLIQEYLNWAINEKLDIDGCYGPATTKAVKKFQKVTNIKQDGSYGQQTLTTAQNFVKKG